MHTQHQLFEIIPVIDLKDGKVVSAQQGRRNHYQPINSALCGSSDIFTVLSSYLTIHKFNSFYIADLNAIATNGNHCRLINNLLLQFPGKNFYVDRGYISVNQMHTFPDNYLPVIGTESYNEKNYIEIMQFSGQFTLSLDYLGDQMKGPEVLFKHQSLWPENIILMTLSRIGRNIGPDIQRLSSLIKNFPEKNFIAAGGIRSVDDLLTLDKIGIHKALISSALHSGMIGSEHIQMLQTKKYPS